MVDTHKEKIAVDEARKLKIPVIGVVDTNCDPDEVDFVIPGNDDALRSIRLFTSRLADAIVAAAACASRPTPSSRRRDGGDDAARRARPPAASAGRGPTRRPAPASA